MHRILLVGFALVASCVATPAAQTAEPLLFYHEAVGFKLAADIRANEEAYMQKLEAGEEPASVDSNSRIVGGSVSNASKDHPHLGGLVVTFANLPTQSVCGSTLLTPNRLVTAAHCWFDGMNQASMFEVVLGSEFLFFGGTRLYTTQVVTHPQFVPQILSNDIAMIYLPINVYLSDNIWPATLPSTGQLQNTFVGEWAAAAGFGVTSDDQTGIPMTTQIHSVGLQIISVQDCLAVYGPTFVTPSTICTSGQNAVGICAGDFGGPLVISQGPVSVLVGVGSFVNANGCQYGSPSGFSRVTSFHAFIQQHL